MDDGKYYLLGIDGGGTKTHFKLTDLCGQTLKEVFLSSTNPNDVGLQTALDTLREGILAVTEGLAHRQIYAYAGIAGAAAGKNNEAVKTHLREYGFARSDAGGDIENIISAGLRGKDGMILILGTGICAFSVKGAERYRTSGWGYLLDQGGSGYNYGCDVLNAYYTCLDHTGEQTILYDMVFEKTGLNSTDLLTRIYELGKSYIASFAPLAFEAAQRKDPVAEAIVQRNVKETVRIIQTALKPFDSLPVPVIVSGGLTANHDLIDMIRCELPLPTADMLSVLTVPPVDGAILLAEQLICGKEKRN